MNGHRHLVVIADDFGMGPGTTQGILELGIQGIVNGTVLMVNSPYAAEAVLLWRKAGQPMELGWHPNLTMDPPILPAHKVPTLVRPDGCLWPLGAFVRRLLLGRIDPAEIAAELRAQYQRFRDLVGCPPSLVNTHQHVGLFGPVGKILLEILDKQRPWPYVRRVQEPWAMIRKIPGARSKRSLLNYLGRDQAREQHLLGFPGNDWLVGITDPKWVRDSKFHVRWLEQVPGNVVELACHPGHYDRSLIGRDCGENDGLLQRRVDEWKLLQLPSFREVVERAGFIQVAPSQLRERATLRWHQHSLAA